jgi:hypothetical protein
MRRCLSTNVRRYIVFPTIMHLLRRFPEEQGFRERWVANVRLPAACRKIQLAVVSAQTTVGTGSIVGSVTDSSFPLFGAGALRRF